MPCWREVSDGEYEDFTNNRRTSSRQDFSTDALNYLECGVEFFLGAGYPLAKCILLNSRGLEEWFLEWSRCKKKFTYASDCSSAARKLHVH